MKYSIIIVTRNSLDVLPACLESIIRCSVDSEYEVIIVDNASDDDSAVFYSSLEGDVNIIFNEFNSGFARASNQGITASSGDYIVLLNPDTVVTPGWLDRLSSHFKDESTGAVGPLSNYVAGGQKYEFYLSDQTADTPEKIADSLSREYRGQSTETKFLIGFCMMIPWRIIEVHGDLDDDLILGNEDLEYSHRLRKDGLTLKIALDTFIYHQGQTTFAKDSNANRWVNFSARILEKKLINRYGNVDSKKIWGMDWFKPAPNLEEDLVSIVIPTFNCLEFTRQCLESIDRHTLHPHEIIVVDNGSTDGSKEYLRALENIKLIENAVNKGYPAACNQGIKMAGGKYILLLNNDTIVTDLWLSRMFSGFFADPKVGIIGPRSNDSAGLQKVSSPGYKSVSELDAFAKLFREKSARQFRNVDFLSGFCMLIDKKVVEKIGLFDEQFGIGNYEDQDICRRAVEGGFKLLVVNEVYIHHYGSRSFVENGLSYNDILAENRKKYEMKWMENPL